MCIATGTFSHVYRSFQSIPIVPFKVYIYDHGNLRVPSQNATPPQQNEAL